MSNTPEKHLGQKIRFFREQMGLSQEKLAKFCGLHRTYIGSIERGERNISRKNIVKIAHALKITPSELLSDIK